MDDILSIDLFQRNDALCWKEAVEVCLTQDKIDMTLAWLTLLILLFFDYLN